MKVISWNCNLPPWSSNRKPRLPHIARMINSLNPDIICLQEVFFESDADFLKKYFKKVGLAYSSKYQNLYILSKFPIKVVKNHKFQNQGKLFSVAILDVLYGKAVQILEVKSTQSEALIIANTHLLSAYSLAQPIYQLARLAQCKEIIEALNKLPQNSLLVDDFNFVSDTEPYRCIVNQGFVDVTSHITYTYHG